MCGVDEFELVWLEVEGAEWRSELAEARMEEEKKSELGETHLLGLVVKFGAESGGG